MQGKRGQNRLSRRARLFPTKRISAAEGNARANAWLSVDERDDDLTVFVTYVAAAVRTVFPDACRDTLALVSSGKTPRTEVLATHLSNDLDALGEPFVLALDDYHTIQDRAIHELVDHLVRHPVDSLQLVLMSRRDPPLSLGSLRAAGRLVEIRMQDLQFTKEQTAAFLATAAPGTTLDGSALSQL